jgi:hypothetical protein
VCTWSPPWYLSRTYNFSSSPVTWSVAPESIYQIVSTPYDVVAYATLFCGGPVQDGSKHLKHLTT